MTTDPSALPSDRWHVSLGDYVISRTTRPVGKLNPRELGIARWVSPDTTFSAEANLVLAPDGSIGVAQIVIASMDQARPEWMITSSALRQIPISSLLAEATRAYLEAQEDLPLQPILADVQTDAFKETLRTTSVKQQAKRTHLSDELLKTVAILYLQEYGGGRGMQKRMSTRLGDLLGESVAETQVRDWISAARRRGWLTTGQAGRRAAGPGWKLLQEGGENVPVEHPGIDAPQEPLAAQEAEGLEFNDPAFRDEEGH